MTEARQPINTSDAAAIIAATEDLTSRQGHVVDIGGRKAVILRTGEELATVKKELDKYLDKPERITSTTTMDDLASFMNELDRYKNEALSVYVHAIDPGKRPSVVAVVDDHLRGAPAFREHRTVYSPNPSNEICAWLSAAKSPVSQEAFAELIEERFGDICDPDPNNQNALPLLEAAKGLGLEVGSPAQLLELSRGLQINVGQTIKGKPNLHNGTTSFVFEESAQPTVKVPGAVLLDVPFFEGAPSMLLLARIRYKVQSATAAGPAAITWRVLIHDLPRAYRESVEAMCAEIREAGHRVVLGQP